MSYTELILSVMDLKQSTAMRQSNPKIDNRRFGRVGPKDAPTRSRTSSDAPSDGIGGNRHYRAPVFFLLFTGEGYWFRSGDMHNHADTFRYMHYSAPSFREARV